MVWQGKMLLVLSVKGLQKTHLPYFGRKRLSLMELNIHSNRDRKYVSDVLCYKIASFEIKDFI